LYLDNHGSTKRFGNIHRFTEKEKWGIRRIPLGQPEVFVEVAIRIREMTQKGNCPYKAIILDDISEQALLDMAARTSYGTKKSIASWGEHLDIMTKGLRYLDPEETGLWLFIVGRAGRMPVPTQQKTQKFNDKGEPVFTPDDRDTYIGPLLRGQFGAWAPGFFDMILYHDLMTEERGNKMPRMDFRLHLAPIGDVRVKNRFIDCWMKDPKLPLYLSMPTFDQLADLLEGLPAQFEMQELELPVPVITEMIEGDESNA